MPAESVTVTPELWVALITGLGTLGGTIKWAVGRWESGQKSVAHQLFETRVLIAAILERDRIRDERRKRETLQPLPRRGQQAVPIEIPGETTDIITLMDNCRDQLTEQDQQQEKKARSGIRPPRKGTHHDTED